MSAGEGWDNNVHRGFLAGDAYSEPSRLSPRLAFLVAQCDATSPHVASIADQLAACQGVCRGLGGRFDGGVDLYVVQCGHGALHGPMGALADVVAGGLYDGVVVAGLESLPSGEYSLLTFKSALLKGSCELYVAGRPDITLWGPKSIGFEPTVMSLVGPTCDEQCGVRCSEFGGPGSGGPGSGGPGSAPWWSGEWWVEPERLLTVPSWSVPDEAGWRSVCWVAALASRSALDRAEADLEVAELTWLAAPREARQVATEALTVSSDLYWLLSLRTVVLLRLSGLRDGSS